MGKKISILGATGTIGDNCINLILQNPNHFEVQCLFSKQNAEKLLEQAIKTRAKHIILCEEPNDKSGYIARARQHNIAVHFGVEAVAEFSQMANDIFISASVGFSALVPTYNAIGNSKIIGLANKEAIVCAGSIILSKAKQNDTPIIPIDSEHNGIFQLLATSENAVDAFGYFDYEEALKGVRQITITASGGPFRGLTAKDLRNVTVEQALAHPNWNMGAKISIDSATMMNKGLEIIEACKIFDISLDKISAIIHPQSVIHAIVDYIDGSSKMAHSIPDMRVPLANALYYPCKVNTSITPVRFTELKQLCFEEIDISCYPCFELAMAAYNEGDVACIALNAANELAVAKFLNREIKFIEIAAYVSDIINRVLKSFGSSSLKTVEEVVNIDRLVREIEK